MTVLLNGIKDCTTQWNKNQNLLYWLSWATYSEDLKIYKKREKMTNCIDNLRWVCSVPLIKCIYIKCWIEHNHDLNDLIVDYHASTKFSTIQGSLPSQIKYIIILSFDPSCQELSHMKYAICISIMHIIMHTMIQYDEKGKALGELKI